MSICYDDSGRAICPVCQKPLAKAGSGLSGNKSMQLYRCSNKDCPERNKRKMSKELFVSREERNA